MHILVYMYLLIVKKKTLIVLKKMNDKKEKHVENVVWGKHKGQSANKSFSF